MPHIELVNVGYVGSTTITMPQCRKSASRPKLTVGCHPATFEAAAQARHSMRLLSASLGTVTQSAASIW
jgi:hypothetical protein